MRDPDSVRRIAATLACIGVGLSSLEFLASGMTARWSGLLAPRPASFPDHALRFWWSGGLRPPLSCVQPLQC